MHKLVLRSVFALALLLVAARPSAATLIDFEEFSPPAGGLLNASPALTSQGYTFSAAAFLGVMDNGQPNGPNSGSNTLQSSSTVSHPITLTESSGAAFDLISLRLSEGRNTTTGFFNFSATSVRLDGVLAAGGAVTTTFLLDLFAQENDLLDFESFAPAGFVGLSSVTFTGLGGVSGNSFQLEDITVDLAVPEASTAALLALALVGFFSRRRGEPGA